MTKNIIIVVLAVIIIILGYMLMVTFPERAEAECTIKCTEIVQAQVTSAVQECMSGLEECILGVEECQQTLEQLIQVPECAAAIAQ